MRINKPLLISAVILIGAFLFAALVLPVVAQSGNPENPLKFGSVGELINQIADFIIIVALPIATIMIIYAAFLFITAGGSEDKVKKAKQVIILAVVGIAILLMAKGAALVIKDVLGVNPSPTNSPSSTNSPAPTISPQSTISPSPTASAGPLTIISSEFLPNGSVAKDYPPQTMQVEGGRPAYVWSVSSGSLPPGVGVSGSGTVSGTPTKSGSYSFSIKTIDSLKSSASKNFQLTVNPPPETSKCITVDGSGSIGIELIARDPDYADEQSGCSAQWSLQSFLAGEQKIEWVAFVDSLKSVLHNFKPITAARWTLYRSDDFGTSACQNVSEKVFVVPCYYGFRAFAYSGNHEVHLSLSKDSTTLAHEIGHSFANLSDEYSESPKLPKEDRAGNCIALQNTKDCPWSTGCFDGCNYQSAGKGWYRDAQNDLMYDNNITNNQYGPIDMKIIRALLSK